MANYAKLTPKQLEMLEPLETAAKANRKKRDRLQKRLAFFLSMGWEENAEVHKQIAELDDAYAELSANISEIYNAQSEIKKHMSKAIDEIKAFRELKTLYGFGE